MLFYIGVIRCYYCVDVIVSCLSLGGFIFRAKTGGGWGRQTERAGSILSGVPCKKCTTECTTKKCTTSINLMRMGNQGKHVQIIKSFLTDPCKLINWREQEYVPKLNIEYPALLFYRCEFLFFYPTQPLLS